MEILSFALGMVTVVVITMVVVAIVAFVKAKKNEKNLENFMNSISHEISHIQDNTNKRLDNLERETYLQMELNHKELDSDISKRTEQIHRRIDELQSQLDSRFDKQQDKTYKIFDELKGIINVKENNNNKILLKD
jgi:biopolymer transport protein ExbB/TolQ